MEHADPDHIRKHLRKAVMVFVTLLVLTVITVLASYMDLGHSGNIALALVIATIKASLVGAYFMHLIDEKQFIYAVLIVCAAFFAVMMWLPIFHSWDPISH